ncbi:Rrf2 family transcriptional regulator [Mangrovicoccus sp. HB161399]|uniref:RrF2 family transcriptional regulator n=1 Tax=Mangrovicoccus sp. HB161399 TaxID=2720392 RepID=UPI001553A3AC|nr:Rrf2 family transcriptional regulator [Mangrovicoccus sp. HB161399]
MRLSKFTDYAVRICLYLAAHQDRIVPIAEMARAHDLSKNNLMKVAQQLIEGGFLESLRGRAGGVRLARPASGIRLGQVVRHMEGDCTIVDCGGCLLTGSCGLLEPFAEAQLSFYRSLDRLSLADALLMHPRTLGVLQRAAANDSATTG